MSMNGYLVHITADLVHQLDDEDVIGRLVELDALFLGKAWAALHWVLDEGGRTGESAVLGGPAVDCYDTGYGPPSFFTPAEVVQQADELDTITDQQIRDVFDLEQMARDKVWPTNPDLDELIDLAGKVRAYYKDAAAKGHGMLMYRA